MISAPDFIYCERNNLDSAVSAQQILAAKEHRSLLSQVVTFVPSDQWGGGELPTGLMDQVKPCPST